MRKPITLSLLVLLLSSGPAPAQEDGKAVAQLRAQSTTASAMLRLYMGEGRHVWDLNLRRARNMTAAALVCEGGTKIAVLADLSARPLDVTGRFSGTIDSSGSVCGAADLAAAVAAGRVRAEVAQEGGPTIVGRVRATGRNG